MDETNFKSWLDDFEKPLYEQWVQSHQYDSYSSKTTVVVIKLKSGFEIVGTSGCEDPSKFSEQLGHKYALKDALRKLGEFTAFHRAENRYTAEKLAELTTPIKGIFSEPVDCAHTADPAQMPDYIRKEIQELIREELRKYIRISN